MIYITFWRYGADYNCKAKSLQEAVEFLLSIGAKTYTIKTEDLLNTKDDYRDENLELYKELWSGQ